MEPNETPTELVETVLPGDSSTESVSSPDEIYNVFGDDSDSIETPEPESPTSPEGAPGHATPDGETGATPTGIPPGPVPAAPAPPVIVPGAVVPQAPVAPVVPVAQPAGAPTAAQAPAPVAAPAPGPDIAQMRENLVTEIAGRYSMSDQVRDEFMMNPEKVLPTFAARLYVDIYDAVLGTVMSQIPQVMGAREQQVQVQRSAEERFFTRWPTLKDPNLQRDIASVARTYRQQNPQASFEQSIEAVGAMVSVMKGVPLPGQTSTPSPAPPQRPPIPAGVGASRAPAPAAPQTNLFEEVFSRDD